MLAIGDKEGTTVLNRELPVAVIGAGPVAVSYTHLTLPTNREV